MAESWFSAQARHEEISLSLTVNIEISSEEVIALRLASSVKAPSRASPDHIQSRKHSARLKWALALGGCN